MPTKLNMIRDLSRQTLESLSGSKESWAGFLHTAAFQYKYPFHDQVLIHAQRPDATACASYDLWNKRIGRYINRGAKGIALLDMSGARPSLRYVFDVSDTNARSKEPFAIWEMRESDHARVLEELANHFGDNKDFAALSFQYQLYGILENVIADHITDYAEALYRTDDTIPATAFAQDLRQALIYCIGTITLTRLGMDAEALFRELGMEYPLERFNTIETATILGTAASDISEMILRQAERTIREIRREEREKVAEISPIVENEIRADERSEKHERHHLHADRRLSDSQPDIDPAADNGERQIWEHAQEILAGESPVGLQPDGADGGTLPPLAGDRPDGAEADQADGSADGAGRGRDGGHESREPVGVGAADEQHQAPGRGDGDSGTGLQLGLFPSEAEQIQAIETAAEVNRASASSMPRRKPKQTPIYAPAPEAATERADSVYRFSLGDTVHIGWFEHTILSLAGNTVTLSDPKYPLLTVEMPRAEFERKARENPLNDHLIVEEPQPSPEVAAYAEPYVIIKWSESSRFEDGERLTFTEADAKFKDVEKIERQERTEEGRLGGYNKTKGNVFFLASPQDTELSSYEFRYDIGDYNEQDSGLYNHIRNFWTHVEARNAANKFSGYTAEDVDSVKPFLSIIEQYRDLTPPPPPIEEKILPDIVGREATIAGSVYRVESVDGEKTTLRNMERTRRNGDPVIRIADTSAVISIFAEKDSEHAPADAQAPEAAQEQDDDIVSGIDVAYIRESLKDLAHSAQVDVMLEAAVQAALEYEREIASLELPAETTPESPPAVNFRITNDDLGHGGQKTKYQYNVDAIRVLKAIEAEHRPATPAEQETLSRYVGWGGIPQAFDETRPNWANEYAELKGLLSENEYEAARASTLNAHYTSPVVIKAMYEAIGRMGFSTGNILEPAMGVGNFFGLLPEGMQKSRLYGVELDGITGRIAQQLYPNARIAVQGYEDTTLPDNFFDIAVGNVPFGGFGVLDKRYEKNSFLIHDYFFAKSLDKVRPGGIVAFITSKGTLDKRNPEVRKYIAQRADLLGAVRLPNNAFLSNAGTEVTTDILFLQKRDTPIEAEPEWVHLSETEKGVPINAWYTAHPEMVLGEMAHDKKMYGNTKDTTCHPIEGADLKQQLQEALSHIHGNIPAYEHEQELDEHAEDVLPADPDVRNYSYTIVDDKIYYREDSIMRPVETSITGSNRIKGMVELRDCMRALIDMQLEGYADAAIEKVQKQLNSLYDAYTAKYGILNSRANEMAFSDDSGYFLLCSLELLDDDQQFERKADMFTKRTIRPQMAITRAETPAEALTVSISEHGKVDMDYMQSLTGLSEEAIVTQLGSAIFKDFQWDSTGAFSHSTYRTADEFLSGEVRKKLQTYQKLLGIAPEDYEHLETIKANVEALKGVQPKDLSASEIMVRLGATWLPPEIIKEFADELLQPDDYGKRKVQVLYSPASGNWNVTNKTCGRDNEKVCRTYGTRRMNAYWILENSLNLRDVRIFDTVHEDGKEKRVLNAKETIIAQQKQQAIKDAFSEWIWKDPERREKLVRLYNDTFNGIRHRVYDGSNMRFIGMNPEIMLRPHQVNAVAQSLYGGNTLLAHTVGAGKTYTMAAIAMESKRIGLTHKSMIVVPNHIVGQFAGEFLQLYPSANILVATKKDFEPGRRKKFIAKIATGNYDAIIIGHSQFERIPMSIEKQQEFIENQIDEVIAGIIEAKNNKAENFTVKQLEATKKSLEIKLKKLNNTRRKDDVITFEQLGVDRLMIDEADNYKNLFFATKQRNVAGIGQAESQKASDLYMKSQYINEITENRGMVFATGTPISNSMVEMFTMQRYLQPDTLRLHGIHHFDSWAATFGESTTAIEIAPEGKGYRAKTRFAKFHNIPELLGMFKLVADIQTKDMLNLPTPEVKYFNVPLQPSEIQREMVASFAERAEQVRNGSVPPTEDNLLKITSDGRKVALDQRLLNPLLPDNPNSKANACADRVTQIWANSMANKSTQLVFSDLGTPKADGSFSVYDDLREKLIARGIPAEQIAFIHEANTELKKMALFARVRMGKVRVLIGSTEKMGAGTNVQTRLIAEHHLDCPWRPRDIEQREGRIERQGNENPEVEIYRYVTEASFDSYMWQTIENKQRFISQIMTSKNPARSCEDIDETALSYAEVKALCAGDPDIKERMQLDTDIKRLQILKSSYLSNRYDLEDAVTRHYPKRIADSQSLLAAVQKDAALMEQHAQKEFSGMELLGAKYTEKAKAGEALLAVCKMQEDPAPHEIGRYCGFKLFVEFSAVNKSFFIAMQGSHTYRVELGQDVHGNIQRLDNILKGLSQSVAGLQQQITEVERQKANAETELKSPFSQELELKQKQARLAELDAKLKINERGNDAAALDSRDDRQEQRDIALER